MAAYPRCRNAGSLFWDVSAWNLAERGSNNYYSIIQGRDVSDKLTGIELVLAAVLLPAVLLAGIIKIEQRSGGVA